MWQRRDVRSPSSQRQSLLSLPSLLPTVVPPPAHAAAASTTDHTHFHLRMAHKCHDAAWCAACAEHNTCSDVDCDPSKGKRDKDRPPAECNARRCTVSDCCEGRCCCCWSTFVSCLFSAPPWDSSQVSTLLVHWMHTNSTHGLQIWTRANGRSTVA